MQCKYVKQDGSKCHREALPDSEKGFCILHEDWDCKDEEETKEVFYREIEEGTTDFEGCILAGFSLSEREFEGDLNFNEATIKGGASLDTAKINGDVYFEGATVDGPVFFEEATIKGRASFDHVTVGAVLCDGAIIEKGASFEGAIIDGIASFRETTIKEVAQFWRVTIEGDAWFNEATIEGDASFDGATIKGNALFNEATIKGDVSFSLSNISYLTFKNAAFNKMSGQEEACRTARRTQERLGDRILADYHFYREMEAKRKQKYKTFSLKPILELIRKLRLEEALRNYTGFFGKQRRIYWGFLELPVQYIFGYGVYPWRVIATWLLAVFSLAFVYWIGNGVEAADSLLEYIYFSVVTAATPGYGGYHPKPGIYQGLASFEAIFGTFMWAAFIATFARKYMR